MVDNLHCAPSWGIINNNHPFFGSSLLGMAFPFRVMRARVRVRRVSACNYNIGQHYVRSPDTSTSFAFFLMLCSEVCDFFGVFTIFYHLMVSRSIFPLEKPFLVFSSEYLLFKHFYSFEEGYLSNYTHKLRLFCSRMHDKCFYKISKS